MWKKLVLSAGLMCCLGLPAFAADAIAPDVLVKKTIPVELKGKLLRTDRSTWEAWRPWWTPGDPTAILWQLATPDQVYELDLDNKHDLWLLAEANVGKTVLVKGTWDGDFLHVASLKADPEHVKKTVKVEVKGRLGYAPPVHLRDEIQPADAEAKRRLPRELWEVGGTWEVFVGDKTYSLLFGDDQTLARANELLGRTVVITGELRDNVITVASLKADDEYFKVKETAVEIKGKLQFVVTDMDGRVVRVCDEVPEDFYCKTYTINVGVVVDGQTYILDCGENFKLRQRAEMFVGVTVVLTGALDGDHVKLGWLNPEDAALEVFTKN
jgi:hypothetical protein